MREKNESLFLSRYTSFYRAVTMQPYEARYSLHDELSFARYLWEKFRFQYLPTRNSYNSSPSNPIDPGPSPSDRSRWERDVVLTRVIENNGNVEESEVESCEKNCFERAARTQSNQSSWVVATLRVIENVLYSMRERQTSQERLQEPK